VLNIDHVSRRFGAVQALDDVTFSMADHGMTGFIGGNGAGKTTTMRIIMGIITADSGGVRWRHAPITPADVRRIGYMPAERGLYPTMPIGKQLAYFARIRGLSRQDAATSTERLLTELSLEHRSKDPVQNLSLGNQQRIQIAAALIGDPACLILDEPFSGLDPIAAETVGEILRSHSERGVPVLFSSHQLDLVERYCDHLVIIADGKIKATGSREGLLATHAGFSYEIGADDLTWLRAERGVIDVVPHGRKVRFTIDALNQDTAEVIAQEVLQRALGHGPVNSFQRWTPSLAEVFRDTIVDRPGEPGFDRRIRRLWRRPGLFQDKP
jgi:ABC-2 type transport system ATP-binding protein